MRRQTPEGAQKTRQRIIAAAEDAFRTVGVKDVTMDSIARSLKMSKRTMYEVFPSKEMLLLECIKAHVEREDAVFRQLKEESGNTLEYLIRAFEYRMNELAKCSKKAFQDIEAYPAVNEYFKEQYYQRKEAALRVMEKGVEEGYFRAEMNKELAYFVSRNLLEFVMHSPQFQKVPINELFLDTVLTYLSGCVTLKGSSIVDDFFKRYR